MGSVLFFPMMALAGAMGPREALPTLLKLLSDILPLTYAFDAMTMLWIGGPDWGILKQTLYSFEQGTPFLDRVWFQGVTVGQALIYLAVLAVVFSAIALKTFRWETE